MSLFARYLAAFLISAASTVFLIDVSTHAQQVGRNVNMVSGTELPGGDPYLQRQNEPSMAVSTRNRMHLVAGANDYRTVDVPGILGAVETGDAWQGVFKSIDGGQSWFSTLLPGYPQDLTSKGQVSPLKDYEAASDPVVRAGTYGMFYYGGMVFDRGESAPSAAFVARYIDLNNKENGDPMIYIDTHLVDSRTGIVEGGESSFIDKPWLATDIPRKGSKTCTITVEQEGGDGSVETVTQEFNGGNVYVAYAVIKSSEAGLTSEIHFSRSTDCGASWSTPERIGESGHIHQGATIAIDPRDGTVYVAWRQFRTIDSNGNVADPDALHVTRSSDGGKVFSKADQVAEINSFDQPTLPKEGALDFRGFRFNAYPTMTVDAESRLYMAWSVYGMGAEEDARVVLSTSEDRGKSWSEPQLVDDAVDEESSAVRCRQLMPSLSFGGGKLMLAYYDFRDDILEEETPLRIVGDPILSGETELHHSVDVRVVQAVPGPQPEFTSYPENPSAPVSRYRYATDLAGLKVEAKRLQYNKPNLPLFDDGTKPFMGDYVDMAPSPMFVLNENGKWIYNTEPTSSAVVHTTWADNRDVRPPPNGDWTTYRPPVSTQSPEFPSPELGDFPNGVCDVSLTGMRNQNIYTSQITEGLYVGSPGNTKPLGYNDYGLFQRVFVAFVRNATDELKSYRLTVLNQPPDFNPSLPTNYGEASFLQFEHVVEMDVSLPPFSSMSRPVFVKSEDEMASVKILVQEIGEPGGTVLEEGLRGVIDLNPDVSNPEILNPEILNADQSTAEINSVEVHNPEILNPEILNPEILNPEILNPEILNPEILNPEILNPEILNPEILNPEILNPEILNPEILNPEILNPEILNAATANAQMTDITWTVTNNGNTTSTYTAKPFVNNAPAEEGGFVYQLLIYRIHAGPAVNINTCKLETDPRKMNQYHELIVDIRNPEILNPEILNPEILNHDPDVATFYAAPGDTVLITLRVLDPDTTDEYDFNPETVALATVTHAVDTDDAAFGETQPEVVILTTTGEAIDIVMIPPAPAETGVPYSTTLIAAGGMPPLTWSEPTGILNTPGPCEGLTLDASGTISGTPTTEGVCGPFTVQVADAAVPQNLKTWTLSIPVAPNTWATTFDGGFGSDVGAALTVDPFGNVYSAGWVDGGSDMDFVTVKYDVLGNIMWSKSYQGPGIGEDRAYAIAADRHGNLYVAGRSEQVGGGQDCTTIKYDSLGNELWVATYDGPAGLYDRATTMVLDDLGNVYVTGWSFEAAKSHTLTIKYDSSGNELWASRYEGIGNSSSEDIALDSFGNVYITGPSFNGTNRDYLTVKYDNDGNQVWARLYDGASGDDTSHSVASDSEGNVYVTGSSDGGATGLDYLTVSYDSLGSLRWVDRYDGPGSEFDNGAEIAVDSTDHVVVAGTSSGGSSFLYDFATLKYDKLGNLIWEGRYDGPISNMDYANSLAVDETGAVVVAGYSEVGTTGTDFAVIKYDASGTELWVKSYNGVGDGDDSILNIALDEAGNVYAIGSSWNGANLDYTAVKFSRDP